MGHHEQTAILDSAEVALAAQLRGKFIIMRFGETEGKDLRLISTGMPGVVYVYDTEEEAIRASKRLAIQVPGYPYIVMEARAAMVGLKDEAKVHMIFGE